MRVQLGLDQPLPTQYLTYMRDMLTGDWGRSIATKQPVLDEILARLPASLELICAAMLIALPVGLALGLLSARWQGRARRMPVSASSPSSASRCRPSSSDSCSRSSSSAAWTCCPCPAASTRTCASPTRSPRSAASTWSTPLITGNWVAVVDVSWHLILPAITLAAYPIGLIARMTRSSMLESLGKDYVRTARAYGVRERLIVRKLALRNALVPVLTIIGLTLAYLLTGTFFVEIVFSWPGLGTYAVKSILATDYPAIMGIALIGAAAYVLINLVVDIAQAWVDPRIRLT